MARQLADALREALGNKLVTRECMREFMDMRLRELESRLQYDLLIGLGAIAVACTALLLALLPWMYISANVATSAFRCADSAQIPQPKNRGEGLNLVHPARAYFASWMARMRSLKNSISL